MAQEVRQQAAKFRSVRDIEEGANGMTAVLILGIILLILGAVKHFGAPSRGEAAVANHPVLSQFGGVVGFSSRADYWNTRPGAGWGCALSLLGLALIAFAIWGLVH